MTSDIFKLSLIFNAFIVKCKNVPWFMSFFLKNWVQKCFFLKKGRVFQKSIIPNKYDQFGAHS